MEPIDLADRLGFLVADIDAPCGNLVAVAVAVGLRAVEKHAAPRCLPYGDGEHADTGGGKVGTDALGFLAGRGVNQGKARVAVMVGKLTLGVVDGEFHKVVKKWARV